MLFVYLWANDLDADVFRADEYVGLEERSRVNVEEGWQELFRLFETGSSCGSG